MGESKRRKAATTQLREMIADTSYFKDNCQTDEEFAAWKQKVWEVSNGSVEALTLNEMRLKFKDAPKFDGKHVVDICINDPDANRLKNFRSDEDYLDYLRKPIFERIPYGIMNNNIGGLIKAPVVEEAQFPVELLDQLCDGKFIAWTVGDENLTFQQMPNGDINFVRTDFFQLNRNDFLICGWPPNPK